MSTYLNNDSITSQFDTIAESGYAQKRRGGCDDKQQNKINNHREDHEKISARGGRGNYGGGFADEELQQPRSSRSMRNEEQRQQKPSFRQQNPSENSGKGKQLLKSTFESLANLVDSKEPLVEGAKILGSFFEGTYKGGAAQNFVNDQYAPVMKYLGSLYDSVRGGAYPYAALVTDHDALHKFLQTNVGTRFLQNVEVDPSHLGQSQVDEAKFAETASKFYDNVLFKVDAAKHIQALKNGTTFGGKASTLASMYFDGPNPIEDLKTDNIISVFKNLIGGKYKFRNGASVDTVPLDDVKREFKDILMSTYNVQNRNGKYIVGGKKKFNQRVDENLKGVGVKLGGAASFYGGGDARIDDDHGLVTFWGKINAAAQFFPLLYLALNHRGDGKATDITAIWWIIGAIATIFGSLTGLFVWGCKLISFFTRLVKGKKAAPEAPAPIAPAPMAPAQMPPYVPAQAAQEPQQEEPLISTPEVVENVLSFLKAARQKKRLIVKNRKNSAKKSRNSKSSKRSRR